MTLNGSILLADIATLIRGFIPLIALLVFVFIYLVESKRKGLRPPRKPNPLADPKAAERARAAAANRGPKPVRNEEIEEFLRRAAQQRGEPVAGSRSIARPGPARPPAKPERLAGAGPQRTARGVRPPSQPESGPPPEPAKTPRTSLAEQVDGRLSTRQFEVRAEQLDEDMQRADREREQQLQRKFDHRLGALSADRLPAEPTPQEAPPTPASPGAALLAGMLQPDSLKQAFLLSEIFRRPEERW